jgi:hypothetical protein
MTSQFLFRKRQINRMDHAIGGNWIHLTLRALVSTGQDPATTVINPAADSSHRDGQATLAAFRPPNDAQRCHLMRTSEYRLGRSAAEWAGSGCA